MYLDPRRQQEEGRAEEEQGQGRQGQVRFQGTRHRFPHQVTLNPRALHAEGDFRAGRKEPINNKVLNYAYTHTCIHIYIYMHTYMYIYMYIILHIYIYIIYEVYVHFYN